MNQQMDTQLPEGWEVTQLNEVLSSIVGGGTPDKSNKDYYKGDIPWMTVKDMNKDVLEDTVDHITSEAVENSSTKIIPSGTPIIATRMSLGKIVTAKFDSAINQDLKAIFLTDSVEKTFFIHWYRSIGKLIESMGTGTTVKGIRLENLYSLKFPLPPLAEQHYLADKLDSLLARIQTVSEQLAAVPALLKQFRQSVLADAVSGKLINIKSLTYQNLNQCAKIHNGARKPISLKERNKIQGNIPYYGATGVVDYVNGYTHKGRFLLVGEDGANLLSKAKDLAYIVEGEIWVNNHAHVLKEYENYSLDFIKIVINSLNLSNWVTGTAQPKLTKKALESLPIPKFTFAEQTEIVRRVEALFALADQIEQQSRAAAERVALLTQSVLAKAFRGELSAQWRCEHPDLISGDNSAAALLARIQAEREATGKKSRRA